MSNLVLFWVLETHGLHCVHSVIVQSTEKFSVCSYSIQVYNTTLKYVVKHKSAKLLMTYAVGKLEAGTLVR